MEIFQGHPESFMVKRSMTIRTYWRGGVHHLAPEVLRHILENWKQFYNPLYSLFWIHCDAQNISIIAGVALKLDWPFQPVRSFDGVCCVEANVPYKTAVSSPEPAVADLPLAQPVKASWRIYYYLWSGCFPLNSKAGSVVFSCCF